MLKMQQDYLVGKYWSSKCLKPDNTNILACIYFFHCQNCYIWHFIYFNWHAILALIFKARLKHLEWFIATILTSVFFPSYCWEESEIKHKSEGELASIGKLIVHRLPDCKKGE